MKNLNDIPSARSEDDDERKDLIQRLDSEGHKAISVGRAVLTIEQGEQGDAIPKGWGPDPLKIAIYQDPDWAGAHVPDELFVHADRAGLMDVLVRRGDDVRRMVPIDARLTDDVYSQSHISTVEAVLELAKRHLNGSFAGYHEATSTQTESTAIEKDDHLAALGHKVVEAITDYKKHLETIPNVFRHWKRTR